MLQLRETWLDQLFGEILSQAFQLPEKLQQIRLQWIPSFNRVGHGKFLECALTFN